MKLKEGFVLKEIAGQIIAMPINSALNLNGIITLNSTAQTLWKALESGVESTDELVGVLTSEYDVSEELAREAAESFVSKLRELDFLD